MSDAPERIWACCAHDGRLIGINDGEVSGWTEYVRADLHATLASEIERLRQSLSDSAARENYLRREKAHLEACNEDLIEQQLTTRAEKAETEIERLKLRCTELIGEAVRAKKDVERLSVALAESDKQGEKIEALLDPHISWEGKSPSGCFAAARAEASAAVKVKALEWRGTDGVWAKADALFGATYRITEYSGMAKPFKLETAGFVGPSGHYEMIEEAKAAAQADYERRILSALAARPAAPQEAGAVAEEFVPNWFVTCVSGDGAPFVKVAFKTLPEAQDFHKRLMTGSLPAALTSPPAQAVTEAQVEAALRGWSDAIGAAPVGEDVNSRRRRCIRAALTAAQEASR